MTRQAPGTLTARLPETRFGGTHDSGGNGMETRIARLESHMEHIRGDITELKHSGHELRRSLHSWSKWALALYMGLAAGLLGTMAKGFGWL